MPKTKTRKAPVKTRKAPKSKKQPKQAVKAANRALLQKRLKVKTSVKKSLPVARPLRDAPSTVAVGNSVPPRDLAALRHMGPLGLEDVPKTPVAHKSEGEVNRPDPKFPVWEGAVCGECKYDASQDPEDPYLYRLECPSCGKEGCDECMPAGRGVACPDCENSVVEAEEDHAEEEDAEPVG